jgi:hypothetical protein
VSQGRLIAKFRPVGTPPEDRKLRDVAESVKTVSNAGRQRRRRSHESEGAVWEATRLSPTQSLEYDATCGGVGPLESQDAVDHVMRSVDALSQHAKSRDCHPDQRRQIFALKNMVMLVLWRNRSTAYVGVWKHTSQSSDMPCWACEGTGDAPGGTEPCPGCQGTCVRKRKDSSVLAVFAVQGGGYSTTWHLPSGVADRLLGRINYGNDLVSSHEWPSFDTRKTPITLSQEDYERRRSYLAWFVTKSST